MSALSRLSNGVLLLFVCALCQAQIQIGSVPNQPATTTSIAIKRDPISGTVYNSATGEPVGRALVKVNAGRDQLYAFTGSDGRFQIDGVPEGPAVITAQRPGFLDAQRNMQPFSRAASFAVGQGDNDFRVPLQPAARITGTVLDSDGEPIEGVQVQITIGQVVQGRKIWMNRGGGMTDDSGTYAIENLEPGDAYVHTANHPLPPGQVFPARYYPDADDTASAQVVPLNAGQQARADFTLRAVRGFNVSGTAAGLPPGIGFQVWVEGPNGDRRRFPYQFDVALGRFTIRLVPAGSWDFHFGANDQGRMFEGERQVTVAETDIKGLQVILQSGADIPVEINDAPTPAPQAHPPVVFTGSAVRPGGAQVRLLPEHSNQNRQYYSRPMPNQEAPRMEVPGVPPGKYQVLVQAFGRQCVDTVTSGGTDLVHNPLIVAAGVEPAPITVSMRNDCGTLTATVHSDKENVPTVLLLFSDSVPSDPQMRFLQPNPNGEESMFVNLSPGDYRLYAFSDLDGLEYMNPDALRNFSAQQFTVDPSGKANVTVDRIDRSGK